MEEKQLDFNAPLLSVRRFSSNAASSSGEKSKRIGNSLFRKSSIPHYKSDLKSGPVRNAGAVPFQWEQIPGRPKDKGNPQSQSLDRTPVAPKLPPGRVIEVKQRPPEKEVEDRPDIIRPQLDNVLYDRQVSIYDDNAIRLESLNEGVKENKGSHSEEEGDDAFTDAPDTLSRSESFFFNCSVSGVSGLDGPDAKPSGTFMTDPQTRDFMMGRFLPAAKAMASDSPQYAPRRQPQPQPQPQPVVYDREPPPRQVTRVVNGDRSHPLSQYRPYVESEYVDVIEEESEDEDEDDDDDYNEAGTLSAKGCGLFPRLCLRSSLCLLNPVPGMKVRSRSPLSSVRKVSTLSRAANSGAHTQNDHEKHSESVYKQKLIRGLQLLDERKHEANELTCWSGSQTPDGSSKNGHSGDGGISPYRNEATQSPFHEGVGFLGTPKQVKNLKAKSFDPYKKGTSNFHEVAFRRSSDQGANSLSPMIEKTLYIDSVHVVDAPDSNSSSIDVKGLNDFKDKDSETLVESQRTDETSLAELFLQDINDLNILKEGGRLQSKTTDVVSSDLNSSSDRSNHGEYMDSIEGFREADNLDQEAALLVSSKVAMNGNPEFDKPQPLSEDDQNNLSLVPFQAPLAPPLPKSPSESWLWRTLPSVSSRNSAQFSRKQLPKRSSVDYKWETIVKTSIVNHNDSRFSEELKKPVSQ